MSSSSSITSAISFLTSSSSSSSSAHHLLSSSSSSNGSAPLTIDQEDAIYYHYVPSAAFAIVAFIVFMILFVWLSVQCIRFAKGGWFTSILALGALLEAVGYILRYLLTNNWSTNVFIVSYVLILVTPNFFASVA